MARIVDKTGLCAMTPTVKDIHLSRQKTVKMHKPYQVPKRWSTRAGQTHDCKVNVGGNHDLSYDSFAVPVDWIELGTNTLYTFSDTIHHGLEVQWPGMVLLTQYDKPERGISNPS